MVRVNPCNWPSSRRRSRLRIAALCVTLAAIATAPGWASDQVGVFRGGFWYLDANGDGTWDAGDNFGQIGQAGDITVVGDWNGDGRKKIGIFRNGLWVLDYNGNGVWDGTTIDRAITLGQTGDIPVVGDWNGDGRDKVGVFRNGLWVLDYNGNGVWDGPGVDVAAYLGQSGDVPVVGDWNGSGTKKMGVFRSGLWVLDYNGNFQWDGTTIDRAITLGQAGDVPVAGDWNGTHFDKVGVFRSGLWFLDYNGNGVWDGLGIDVVGNLGQSGDVPVVGDWNGSGTKKIGVFRSGLWVLDYNGNFQWDGPPADRYYGFGTTGDTPVVGRWVAPAAPPSLGPVTPTGNTGSQQTFSFLSSDADGGAYINSEQLLFANTSGGSGSACYFFIDPGSQWIWLRDDANSTWGSAVIASQAGTLTNGQCSLNAAASSITVSGVNLTVILAVTFYPAFAGPHNITMEAVDWTGLPVGPAPMGTWTVPDFSLNVPSMTVTAGAPSNPSATITVTPINGFSSNVTFTATPPPHFTLSFSPQATSPSLSYLTNMYVTADPTVAPGPYTLSYVADAGGGLQHTGTIAVSVGPIVVVSETRLSSVVGNYRWEPSSATSGFVWLESWHDIGTAAGQSPVASSVHAYTRAWDGVSWSPQFEHTRPDLGGGPIMDTFTYWDGRGAKFALTGIAYASGIQSVLFRYSTDASGASWGPMSVPLQGVNSIWDFPSVAVDQNTGRVVVGASKVSGVSGGGYWTAWSDDQGVNWNGPYSVNGETGGGTSRMVWSASGFHAFIVDAATNPSVMVLQHWQSADGQVWSRQTDVSQYSPPHPSALIDPTQEDNPASPAVSFAWTPDAVSSPGLGWVVAYPVGVTYPPDPNVYNAINVNTELGSGVTISTDPSNPVNLASAAVATSAAGDWYLRFQTFHFYTGKLDQRVVYRAPGGGSSPTYKNELIQPNIDPIGWFHYDLGAGRCLGTHPCYSSGDWFRPAMDSLTHASVPTILPSSYMNDMSLTFIHDPPGPNELHFLFEPRKNGDNIASRGALTPDILKHIAQGHYRFRTSSMLWDYLYRVGLLPK